MKKLTFSELFAIGLGFTLGSAVFSLTGVSAMYTGGSTFLAYIVGAFAIFFTMLPVIIAASIVPRQGVSYSLSKEAFSPAMGGFYFWIFSWAGSQCLQTSLRSPSSSHLCLRR